MKFMSEAIRLAKLGEGFVAPNPLVGAVIVKNNKIIGSGYHQEFGGPHAEVVALKNCKESPEGATLYCTLSPCCHTEKKTPPCLPQILASGIKKVIIATDDPNPLVKDKAIQLLLKANIQVQVGMLEDEAKQLNERFNHFMATNLPFVHLKWAQSLDGQIALKNGQSQWITSQDSRNHAHYYRVQNMSIGVGSRTLKHDDPKLNPRYQFSNYPEPWKIIFGNANPSAQIFQQKKVLIINDTVHESLKHIEHILVKRNQHLDLKEALVKLGQKNIHSILVEGGAELISSFIDQKLAQRVSIFIAPRFLGQGKNSLNISFDSLNQTPWLKNLKTKKIGPDILVEGLTDNRE